MEPHTRVRAWRRWAGLSTRSAASLLGCSASMVVMLEGGARDPGRRLAAAIERHTGPWPEGPITVHEWDREPVAEVAG